MRMGHSSAAGEEPADKNWHLACTRDDVGDHKHKARVIIETATQGVYLGRTPNSRKIKVHLNRTDPILWVLFHWLQTCHCS